MNATREMFSQRWQTFKDQKEARERYSNRLSNLRLVYFLGAVGVIALTFSYFDRIYGYVCLVLLVGLFIALLVYHEKIVRQADYFSRMAEINQKSLQRMTGEWVNFPDNGFEFRNSQHRYSNDLDIFGPASLFQWINTTHSFYGREYLRKLLEDPVRDINSIKKRQGAIRELAGNLELCQALQEKAIGSGDYRDNPEPLLAYVEENIKRVRYKGTEYIFFILPLITLAAITASLVNPAFSVYIPLAFILLQLGINAVAVKFLNDILSPAFTWKNKAGVYQDWLELLEEQVFIDPYLVELQADFLKDERTASQQIKDLDKIVGMIAFKYNAIVHFIVNNLFFWDFHCVFALERWKEKSGPLLRQWINNLGVFESLASMAVIGQINPQWCFPEFKGGPPVIAANSMGHPLINPRQRVDNDFKLDNQIAVITGSNMSGKTTLLRTIGVNLVLAYAGAPVCARNFSCTIMELLTSMRVTDDLSEGISTFYAELLRIKMIIDFSQQEQHMIFLIDEVFRGTNSRDRIIGARNVLLNMNKPWAIGLISTHDYELCDLENDPSGRIINYHFIETYHDNEIEFDYLLKPGPSKTSNAKYLMKMAGIEILE